MAALYRFFRLSSYYLSIGPIYWLRGTIFTGRLTRYGRAAYKECFQMQDNLWAVVLAGGEGERMRPLIQSWLGCARPKQYCTFVGTRSMLRHTIDRTNRVVIANQIVTVIGNNHLTHLRAGLGNAVSSGRILEQPIARGTGAGVFLAATYVMAADPNATFVILPSDHFVYPEPLFV
ncbi:MAG: hypothetical protein EHM18_14670, partial [Acidobacteria bacterium]